MGHFVVLMVAVLTAITFELGLVINKLPTPMAHAQVQRQIPTPSAIDDPRETPEMTRRFAALYAPLQPSVKEWVVQQARIEARKSAPDERGIKMAIRGRFPVLNSTGNGATSVNQDVDALVFLVMMQAVSGMDQDLKTIMDNVRAMNAAKDNLRRLMSAINNEIATGPSAGANLPCRSQFCQSLPRRLEELSEMMSRFRRPFPVRAPSDLSYAKLAQLNHPLKDQLDSINEISETESLRLQMSMDRRSKFIQTLSNIMKKIETTEGQIIQNLK